MKLKIMILSIFFTGCFAGNPKVTTVPTKIELNKNEVTLSTGEKINKFTEDDLVIVTVEPPSAHDFEKSGEKQIWLDRTTPAPFDGVLLNPEAMAYIITEYEALSARADTALKNQRNLDVTKLNLETGLLQIALDADKEKHRIISQGKDDEIKRLKDINKSIVEEAKSPWKKIAICVGALAVGAAAGGGITLLAK